MGPRPDRRRVARSRRAVRCGLRRAVRPVGGERQPRRHGVPRRIRRLHVPLRLPGSQRVGDPFADVGDRARSGAGRHRPHAALRRIGARRRLHNADRAAEREAIGAEIAAMLEGDPETQGQFVAALHAATVFMPGRERTKTNNIKLVQELRVRLRRVRSAPGGRRHVPPDQRLRTADQRRSCSRRSTIRAGSRRCCDEREALHRRGVGPAGAVPVPRRPPRHVRLSPP